jgi:heme-degrading monooxygenase HmoA
MILQIVRFKSAMSEDKIKETYESRSDRYRATNGLLQKYYLRYPETNEYGAVYVWESEKALREFRESDLFKTIGDAYQVQGQPDVHLGEVVMALRPDLAPVAR